MRTRQEHLDWCKQRALEYARMGDAQNAVASMCSDLSKHDETRGHSGTALAVGLLMAGKLNDRVELEKFINGFN